MILILFSNCLVDGLLTSIVLMWRNTREPFFYLRAYLGLLLVFYCLSFSAKLPSPLMPRVLIQFMIHRF